MSNDSNGSLMAVLIGVFLFLTVIGSCNNGTNNIETVTNVPTPRNDYQDMRNRGHSEEDAIIFGILKQQGYSDYDAINATKSSKR